MSKLTNRFIFLAAAVVLPACAGTTTTTTSSGTTGASDGASLAEVVQPAEPGSVTVATDAGIDPTTVPADPHADPDPDLDPTPVPGEVPDDLLLLEALGEPADPAPPTPVDPFVRVPFAAPSPPTPVDPEPFGPVTLVADLEANTPAAGNRTFTAATGCGSHCITDAQISTAGGSSTRYELSVVLDVTGGAEVEAFLTQAPIERTADGRYIAPFSQPTASGEPSADWAPGVSHWETSFVLESATTYHLLVRARDAQGRSAVAGTFTTPVAMGPDELTTPSPCLDGCLRDIRVVAPDDGRSLSLVVDSTVDADVEFQWAMGPLVQTDDGPTLDDPSTRSAPIEAGVPSTLKISGLTPTRSYSFVVIATDQFGSSDRWVATVSTRSPVIWAGIDRVYISGDGDPGSKNRGEIAFEFGTSASYWGERGQAKISSNSTVRLGRDSGGAVEADAFGRYPWIAVAATEQDGIQIGSCFKGIGPDGTWLPYTVKECGGARFTSSSVVVPSMTLSEIEQLSTCVGFDESHPGDRCIYVETEPNSDQQVSFDIVVYFDLDPGS